MRCTSPPASDFDRARRSRTASVSLFAAAAMIAVTGAFAQELVLEEIIVTAQKREQSLQDVPASVSAISGESTKDYLGAGENIRALAGRVPSLNIESSNGRALPRFYIRGLGNIDFDVNANQPVSMVYDEVPLENPVLRAIPLFDVDRIEVLKGPQGTLFGRNTPAGIVKIDSVRPSQETEGYLQAGYGSRDTFSLEGAIGGAISDTVSARLSIKYLDRQDWMDNIVNGPGDDFGGFDELGWRLQFQFDPSDRFSARLKLHGFDMEGSHPQIFYANALMQGQEGLRPGFDEEIVSQDGSAGFDLDHIGGALNLAWQFGDKTFTSITGYDTVENFQRADIDGGLIGGPEVIGVLGRQAFFNVESGDGLDDHHQFSQEFRLSGQSDRLFYQVGVYYFDEEIDVRSNNFDSATGLPTSQDNAVQETTSKAIFGQIEYGLSDAASITAGLRYTSDDKQLDAIPGPGSFAPRATIEADDDYLSGDIALSYDVNPDWNVYGRIATASRGPATLGRFGFVSSADTETLTSFELGFKASLLDGRARWNTSVYTYTNDDQQLTATGGTQNLNRLLNADKVDGSGIETEFEVLVSERLRLRANLSYNDTEIKDAQLRSEQCGSNPPCTGLDPVVGVFPGPFGPVTSVSVDGNPLPRTPEWLFNAFLSYTVPLSSGAEVYFNTDWNYRSDSNIFLYEAVEFVAESRWLGGLRIGWRNPADTLDVALVGRNITDEITVDGALDFLNLTAFVNEPAFWGVEVRYGF